MFFHLIKLKTKIEAFLSISNAWDSIVFFYGCSSLCRKTCIKSTLLKRDTCTRMFIAALFTIARTWKPPKCPSTEDWIRKMWCTYTTEYYSAIKKKDIMPFAATMDGTSDSHTEWNEPERQRQIPYDIPYNWNLISSTNEYLLRKENHGLGEETCGCLMGLSDTT